jgi:hypothetical protein
MPEICPAGGSSAGFSWCESRFGGIQGFTAIRIMLRDGSISKSLKYLA